VHHYRYARAVPADVERLVETWARQLAAALELRRCPPIRFVDPTPDARAAVQSWPGPVNGWCFPNQAGSGTVYLCHHLRGDVLAHCLAHELRHVQQIERGRWPPRNFAGDALPADHPLEHDARAYERSGVCLVLRRPCRLCRQHLAA
jgi:hypothetical protein